MKTTIDIPDDLYRKVKAKAALEGRPVREVTLELYRKWLAEQPLSEPPKKHDDPVKWVEDWIAFGREALKGAPPGPTLRELIDEGRSRLERR